MELEDRELIYLVNIIKLNNFIKLSENDIV